MPGIRSKNALLPIHRVVKFDRGGRRLGTVGEPGPYRQIALSPEEKRSAVERLEKGSGNDIWVIEVSSGIASRESQSDAGDPCWSPDGKRITFTSNRKGSSDLYGKAIGGGKEEPLLEAAEEQYCAGFYGGGHFLLFLSGVSKIFYLLPLDGERKATALYETEFNNYQAHVSPDGRWVTYGTNESGRWDIYVAAFPTFSDRRSVSKAGGAQARGDGKELYYMTLDGKVMAVEVKASRGLEISIPKMLFQSALRPAANLDQYCVTRDGKSFLVMERPEETAKPMTVVVNWAADLTRQRGGKP